MNFVFLVIDMDREIICINTRILLNYSYQEQETKKKKL